MITNSISCYVFCLWSNMWPIFEIELWLASNWWVTKLSSVFFSSFFMLVILHVNFNEIPISSMFSVITELTLLYWEVVNTTTDYMTWYSYDRTENRQNLVVLYNTVGTLFVSGNDVMAPKPCLTPESSSDEDFCWPHSIPWNFASWQKKKIAALWRMMSILT